MHSRLPLTTPWRVIMVADSPGGLLANNALLQNLNPPCALADTSWIKPGKVLREVTLTTVGGKACVDFAVKRHLQYILFDAGWYGPEADNASDATTVTLDPQRSKGPLDLPEVVHYNGGRAEHAVNFPFRGHKGMLFEGGIRVPFCASWPGRIPAGQTVDTPITGLDIFPTALAAAGIAKPEKLLLDGVNLLPYLDGSKQALPRRNPTPCVG